MALISSVLRRFRWRQTFASAVAVVGVGAAMLALQPVASATAAEGPTAPGAFLAGGGMILVGSLAVWLFLDVKHTDLAPNGPDNSLRDH